MAKNRNRRHDRSPSISAFHHRVRDDFSIANAPFDRIFEPVDVRALHPNVDHFDTYNSNFYSPAVRSILPEIEDRRRYTPAGSAEPARTPRSVAKIKMHRLGPLDVFGFGSPRHVLVCLRRAMRKEVLHALRKTGKGSSPPRRFNQFSKVRC